MAAHLISTVKDLNEAVAEICGHSRASHDTETKPPENHQDISGLYPFHGARSFSHIFATKEDEFYFNFNTGGINPKHKIKLQPIFDDKNRIIFYVNAIFDAMISHFDGLVFKNRVVDVPSIARVEYNKHGKNPWDKESFLSLAYLSEYYGAQLKIDLVKQYIKEHDLYANERCRFTGERIPLFNLVPLDLMFIYGCGDGRSTFDCGTSVIRCINYKDEQYEKMRGDIPPMIEVAKNEIQLTSVLIDMKIGGFRIWEDYVRKAVKHERQISSTLHKEIDNLTGGINLNSGKQVAEYLVKRGVEVPRKAITDHAVKMRDNWLLKAETAKFAGKTKQFNDALAKANNYAKGNYQTCKETLAKLMNEYPDLDFLTKITQAKEADKKIGTYYENFLVLMDESGFIHCGLNQEKAKTGRFSSSGPNLQNLEKVYTTLNSDEFCVRKSFIADEGCRLFFMDYSSQEMILMLDQAEEMGVIDKLIKGIFKDFYLATAAQIKEILGILIDRKQAKDTALALAYGKGNELMARDFGYIGANPTQDEIEAGKKKASKFKEQFFAALPKLKKLVNRIQGDIKYYGKIHTPFGRVLYFTKDEAYKGLNGYVQGGAADITKVAMVRVQEEFDKIKASKGLKSRMVLCVHDEICFNIAIGEEELLVPVVKRVMSEAYPHKHIALGVDVEYSPINKYGVSSWGEKIKWED